MSAAGSSVGRPCASSASTIGAQLSRPGEADDRAVEPGEARPVDVGRLAALVLEAAHEGDGVAGARIGQRDAGKGRRADAGRHARDDLEGHALLVQEQRFLAAAIEDERIAPLEPRDELAFAGLFRDQEVDGVLIGG